MSQETVERALALLGESAPADCSGDDISDRIVDLLVLAHAAGYDWRSMADWAERHAAAETDVPDDLELATREAETDGCGRNHFGDGGVITRCKDPECPAR